jgi:agmatinase
MKTNTYSGSYGRVPEKFCLYEKAAIAILPVPYDGTSTWIKGSDRGPQALLDASANMELYDIETDSEVFKHGIVTIDPVSCPNDPEAMVDVVGIGGEHTISVGLVRAIAEKVRDFSVLQLDAHLDTRTEYEGSKYNHACVMSRIGEICPYVQAGIRSMDSSELERLNSDRTFFAHEVLNGSNVTQKILNELTHNVYITIDLDVFDPSSMPSTGTPEPGGLDWYTLIKLIRSVIMEKEVVGIDITELLPNPTNRAPDFMAAKLVYRILSMIFSKRGKN